MGEGQDTAHNAPRCRGYVVLFSILGLIVGGVLGYFGTRPTTSVAVAVATPLPTYTPMPTPTAALLRIHVTGAVRHPAVYRLPTGSIVQDALDAAGGPTADADTEHINLAVELHDQQQVYIPRQGENNPPPVLSGGSGAGESTSSALININTASATELESLPRIGPATAQKIIAYREANGPFQTIEDIQNVPGIGPATFEGFKDMITVR